jgi:hypothetical protein
MGTVSRQANDGNMASPSSDENLQVSRTAVMAI